ncbi:MAG: glycerate 2-kinase [Archaeoglobi archaeon]|nr:glycerate 2-kinase [Archaeoglobi archaeon]
MIKGGRLALMAHPADMINLTVSDVIGDPLDYITGPTVPDSSTIDDALRVLDKYELWEELPESVRKYFEEIDESKESPKESDFERIPKSFILVRCDEALRGAAERCRDLGISHEVIEEAMEGESREDALRMAELIRERIGRERPHVIIAYGENVVRLSPSHGTGGPNQEFSLWTLLSSPEDERMVICSVDTDGSDGGTDSAGAIVDFSTLRFREEIEVALREHNCYEILKRAGDLIFTGETGTNVNDLKVVILG